MSDPNDKIECKIDGAMVHSIPTYIKSTYSEDWTVERYQTEFPDAPLLSVYAEEILRKARETRQAQAVNTPAPATPAGVAALASTSAITSAPVNVIAAAFATTMKPMHEVFDLGAAPAARNSAGNPIPIPVVEGLSGDHLNYLCEVDSSYVFNIELLKRILIGIALNTPVYLWGMHGTGKTTIIQQACARTNRPVMRVQHTLNMLEAEVLGQWIVKDGQTEFQLGPLPMAMINGWAYIADEYDRAMPGVIALYQSVLEGQPLLIKDAPPVFRKIVAHPDFRFFATGNTNGSGDETGLYQGTIMQDSANYSRFGITEEVKYMDATIEENILRSKTGLPANVAKKFVKLANDIRQQFSDSKISMTISPREMLSAAKVGIALGGNGAGWRQGFELAFANRLPRVDQQTVKSYLQRAFDA